MKFNCSYKEILDASSLKPNPKNPNKHSKDQIERLAKIIDYQGQRSPIVVSNQSGFITKGHGRLQAMKKLGWRRVAVDFQDYESEAQEYADIVADNAISEWSELDLSMINTDFTDFGPDFDIDLLGLKDFEIDVADKELGDEEETPEPPKESKVVKGEVYILGDHRLMCGDSTMIDDVDKLMAGQKADMVFTDPPYGIDVVGGGKSFGKVDGGNIIESNLYMKIKGDDTTQTAIDAYNLCVSLQIPVLCFWGANYYASALPDRKKWIFWDKETTGNFSDGELAWTNLEGRVQRFKHVWNGLIKESEKRDKRIHPTQKPIALAEWCFKELSPMSKSVLDLFGGSGSTLIACEKTNRKCFMMEFEPHYISVILDRWEKYTGKKAHRESDNKLWQDIKDGK